MEPLVFNAVLAAAAMHAGWNAVVKVGLDRFSSILLLALVQSALALALLPLFPVPAAAAWPWLGASALLHTGYKLFLIRAYAHGDLSQVYPLARGAAPLLVAVIGWLGMGEGMTASKAAAVVVVALGIALMSARGGSGGLAGMSPRALFYALGAAGFTAAYTLVDAVGARLSGTASGFTMWMFVGDGILMAAWAIARRGPGVLPPLRRAWRGGLLAGALSLGSYWIAIWAFTRAPVALVAALRETSVLFAMLIAVAVLGERPGLWRWGAACLIGAGIVLVRA
jgi:drug/metabolite transporter (DMT)-like permease